jgi:SsrA-binding protein
MAAANQSEGAGLRQAATNRKALRDYQVLEKLEAGVELLGNEVKSVREGHFSLSGGFARIEGGSVILYGFHVTPYSFGRADDQDAMRPKRLLLHRREIDRVEGQLSAGGLTLVPLRVFFNRRNLIKVELGLCRGKKAEDKRETLRRRTAEREAERAIAARTRRR